MKQGIVISSYDARNYAAILERFLVGFQDFDEVPYYMEIARATAVQLRIRMLKKGIEDRDTLRIKLSEAEAILLRKTCSDAIKENTDPALLHSLRGVVGQTDKLLIG